MSAFLISARLLLVGIFSVAGVTKLLDPAGSRRAVGDFGVPAVLAGPVSVGLPLFELGIVTTFLFARTALLGAAAALGVLLAFMAGIALNLARGRKPNCHCFGQLHSKPVGRGVLVRNAVLTAIAAALLIAGWDDPGPSLVAWVVPLTALQRAELAGGIAGLAFLTAQTALLVRMNRLNEQLVRRVTAVLTTTVAGSQPATEPVNAAAEPSIGSIAPSFALPNLDGALVTLDALRASGKPVLIVFSDPACGPCAALMPQLGRWERELAGSVTVAVISRGTAEAHRAKSNESGLTTVLLQQDGEVAARYRIFGTPTGVLVNADGTIGSTLAKGEPEIAQILSRWNPSPVAVARRLAPDFSLPDLSDTTVSLSQFKGKRVTLLFWNPGCGFCQQMLDDLKNWESSPEAERQPLLIISTGSAEDNRAQGLRSTILLDAGGFTVGNRFGAVGTPSAVQVDDDGFLVGEVGVGAPAALAVLEASKLSPASVPDIAAAPAQKSCGPAPLATLPAGAKPIKQDCVHDELLSDSSMVLYNGCRNNILTLNPTGALIWESCDGDHDIEAIVAELRDVFPHTDVDRDVRELLDKLVQADMIQPSPDDAVRSEA